MSIINPFSRLAINSRIIVRPILAVVIYLIASNPVLAVGTSDITLHSKLGEPLRASLQLTDTSDLNKDQLIVRIPSQKVYEQLGVDRNYIISNMKFDIQPDHSVIITSRDFIKEPYLHFVIEIVWPEGQLYREVKLFLDPA